MTKKEQNPGFPAIDGGRSVEAPLSRATRTVGTTGILARSFSINERDSRLPATASIADARAEIERYTNLVARLETERREGRDIQLRLDGLRHELIQGVRNREPWRARDVLGVILMLDAPSWTPLVARIDECPVSHAALDAPRQRRRTINPADFAFMASLPSALTG